MSANNSQTPNSRPAAMSRRESVPESKEATPSPLKKTPNGSDDSTNRDGDPGTMENLRAATILEPLAFGPGPSPPIMRATRSQDTPTHPPRRITTADVRAAPRQPPYTPPHVGIHAQSGYYYYLPYYQYGHPAPMGAMQYPTAPPPMMNMQYRAAPPAMLNMQYPVGPPPAMHPPYQPSPTVPQGYRRESASSQYSQAPWRRGSVASSSSTTHSSGVQQSSQSSMDITRQSHALFQAPVQPSIHGIPEVLTVEEMAFRRGQLDHGLAGDAVPPNPFSNHFDKFWEEQYKAGKKHGGTPRASTSITPAAPPYQVPVWAPLVNSKTQTVANPLGAFDADYSRDTCQRALASMRTLIGMVCRRRPDWERTVCDVPFKVKEHLACFPELLAEYEQLQRDAREALAGGIPAGYHQ